MDISIKKALLIISIYSFFVLLSPTQVSWMIMYFLCFSIIAFYALTRRECVKDRINKGVYVLSFVLLLLIMPKDFIDRWSPSSKVERISSSFGINKITFIFIVSFVLSLFASFFIANVLHHLERTLKKRLNPTLFNYLIVLLLSIVEFLQIQSSALNSFDGVLCDNLTYFIVNTVFYLAINIVICLLFKKRKQALFIWLIIITLFSFICQFVVMFHGSPLFVSELRNAFTAFDVIKHYTITINNNLVAIVLFFIVGICLILLPSNQFVFYFNRISIVLVVASALIISYSLFVVIPINNWNVNNNVWDCGYMVMATDDMYKLFNPFRKPEGYDNKAIKVNKEQITESNVNPNIIIIMNESFCDLSYNADIKIDKDYLNEFYSIKNAAYGYAINPYAGGKTNDSEYELLTSKSTHLLNSSAPFTWIDLNNSSSSIAQYLKECGYTTTAMHDAKSTNYNRNRAYGVIGFDNAYFDDYFDKSSYGNRNVTDESDYKKLIECYETNKDNNQFIFMLTYQNHGGYEQNDDSLDTIHVTEDYGDLSDDLNEYLTSVNYSAIAIKELTDYFRNSDKHVIVCMVGDHAPSFINSLIDDSDSIDSEIKKRSVPYVLWSNYGVDFSDCSGYASMTDLVPMIVEKAGLPISPFYSTILDLRKQFPIRTNFGYVVDSEGNYYKYNENEEKFNLLNNYYYMEYNSLIGGDDYREELFMPDAN